MKRRAFLRGAAAGVAAGTAAAPAIARSQPGVQRRMASSFPKSLDTIFGASETIARRVADITGAGSRSAFSPMYHGGGRQALERGTVDAAEWVGPYDDEKLAFHKTARYYYYPGWWEGGPQLSVIVNAGKWDALRQLRVHELGASGEKEVA